MSSVSVEVRLRPLKLAFLVDPSDTKSLTEAIQVNSFLWGGPYNPIIPVPKRMTKKFRRIYDASATCGELIGGFLDAYDPDFVVPMGQVDPTTLPVGARQVIDHAEILQGARENGILRFGVGLPELCDHVIDKELVFVRHDPLRFVMPEYGKRNRLFLASVFGCLPDTLAPIFWKSLGETPHLETFRCQLDNFTDLLNNDSLYPLRIVASYIQQKQVGVRSLGQCMFFLDVTHALDIINYWNMRALGWEVFPIPVQVSGSEKVLHYAASFAESSYRVSRINPEIFHSATLVISCHELQKAAKTFIDRLAEGPMSSNKRALPPLQHWYPRIWDAWASEQDGAKCCDFESDRREDKIPGEEKLISLKTLDPQFARDTYVGEHPKFVNELGLSIYRKGYPPAEVFPEGGQDFANRIGFTGFKEWRISRAGLTYLSRHSGSRVVFYQPDAETVFSAWLQSRGLEVNLSQPGRTSKEMVSQLGGMHGISKIANRSLIEILKHHSKGAIIAYEHLRAQVQKAAQNDSLSFGPQWILNELLSADVLRLGIEAKCRVCGHWSWYSLKDLDYELRCEHCLKVSPVAQSSPEQSLKWCYRLYGPFGLGRETLGCCSVLLALRFFAELPGIRVTPMMSFEIPSREIEVDLGLLIQESRSEYCKTETVLVECKAFNEFTKDDFKRMGMLGTMFPGALLVFATLRDHLKDTEIHRIQMLARMGVRNMKADRPYNPVMTLTGTELMTKLFPPMCWKKQNGRYSQVANRYSGRCNLMGLCDATSELYLDLKPVYYSYYL